MARKKIVQDGFHRKFIPAKSMGKIEAVAKSFKDVIKDEAATKYKVIELLNNLYERSVNSEDGFVALNYHTFRKHLGLEKDGKRLLQLCIDNELIEQNKKTFQFGVSSYSYRLCSNDIVEVLIPKSKLSATTNKLFDKVDLSFKEIQSVPKRLQPQFKVLQKIKFSDEFVAKVEYLLNHSKEFQKLDFEDEAAANKNIISLIDSITKTEIDKANVLQAVNNERRIPKVLLPVIKTIHGNYRISAPANYPRIFHSFTNLKREFKQHLRLNGKPLVGFDIANSQPLLATIIFRIGSKKIYDGEIAADVLQYQKDCESGKFYDYFMKLNNIPTDCEEARAEFKKTFFGKVFYGKQLKDEHYLKQQFNVKYPTCAEIMSAVKGGNFSDMYKEFPVEITHVESKIINAVNDEMLEEGFDVFTIFDAVYSDNAETIEIAMQRVKKKFEEYGIKPTLKPINYNQSGNESFKIEDGAKTENQVFNQIENQIFNQIENQIFNQIENKMENKKENSALRSIKEKLKNGGYTSSKLETSKQSKPVETLKAENANTTFQTPKELEIIEVEKPFENVVSKPAPKKADVDDDFIYKEDKYGNVINPYVVLLQRKRAERALEEAKRHETINAN